MTGSRIILFLMLMVSQQIYATESGYGAQVEKACARPFSNNDNIGLTYSHDTEIEPYVIARLILQDNEAQSALRQTHLPYKNFLEAFEALKLAMGREAYQLPSLGSLRSDEFSKKFLTKQVGPKDPVSAFDFKPIHLAWLLSSDIEHSVFKWGTDYTISFLGLQHESVKLTLDKIKNKNFMKREVVKLQKNYPHARDDFFEVIKAALLVKGIKSLITLDVGYEVELKSDGSQYTFADVESELATVRQMISSVGAIGSKAQSHFHIGLPSNFGRERLLKVARLVEALIVLERLKSFRATSLNILNYPMGSTYFLSASADESYSNNSLRGPVRLIFDRFEEPRPASDLEIRQYVDKQHVQKVIAFIQKAVEQPELIARIPLLESDYAVDSKFGNIVDSLKLFNHLFPEFRWDLSYEKGLEDNIEENEIEVEEQEGIVSAVVANKVLERIYSFQW